MTSWVRERLIGQLHKLRTAGQSLTARFCVSIMLVIFIHLGPYGHDYRVANIVDSCSLEVRHCLHFSNYQTKYNKQLQKGVYQLHSHYQLYGHDHS